MDLIHTLQRFASPLLDSLMLWITNLGSEQAYIVLLIIAYLGFDASLGRRLGISLLLSFYLNQHLKGIFDTARPFELEPAIVRSAAAKATALGEGFPSGHAQSSLTFWGLAAFYAKKSWFWLIAIIIIALVSLSRVYLGVHLPIDVLGGLIIGLILVALAIGLFPILEGLKVPAWLGLLLGLAIPLFLHLLWPTPDSALLLGALAAYLSGPLLVKHYGSKRVWQRIVLVSIGIVLAFGLLFASSALLPEAIKRHPVGGFLRYLALGYVGTVFVPWLGRVLNLAGRDRSSHDHASP
jgi:membrane-associated phospholipid phosphatase